MCNDEHDEIDHTHMRPPRIWTDCAGGAWMDEAGHTHKNYLLGGDHLL